MAGFHKSVMMQEWDFFTDLSIAFHLMQMIWSIFSVPC